MSVSACCIYIVEEGGEKQSHEKILPAHISDRTNIYKP